MLIALVGVVAGGCKKTVKTAEVASMVTNQLKANGIDGKVTCPESVAAKAGAHFQCNAIVDGEPFTVEVTITSVNGSEGELDVTLPDAIVRDVAVDVVSKHLAEELGQAPAIDCGPKRLLRIVDGKVTCAVDIAGHKGKLVVSADATGMLGGYTLEFPEGPELLRTKLVEVLTKSVSDQLKSTATIDCGTDLLLFPKDDQLTCQVSAAGKTGRLVVHTKGDVVERWEIAD